jgi:hypothetical protein
VSTPLEQLIEAIHRRIDESSLRYDCPPDAREFLQALSDLGAVVLMPMKPGQSVANVIVLAEKHVLRTTQEERDEGVYINALESEQS